MTVYSYTFGMCLVLKERHYQLPSSGIRRHHSNVLLVFFTLLFICENAALVNLSSDDWWFALKTKSDKIELGLFVTRYICTLLLFVLGILAPGITSTAEDDDDPLISENPESDVSINFDFMCGSQQLIHNIPFLNIHYQHFFRYRKMCRPLGMHTRR